MVDNIWDANPLTWFDYEAVLNDIYEISGWILTVLIETFAPFSISDYLEYLGVILLVLAVEGWHTCDHIEYDAAEGPDVDLLVIIATWI